MCGFFNIAYIGILFLKIIVCSRSFVQFPVPCQPTVNSILVPCTMCTFSHCPLRLLTLIFHNNYNLHYMPYPSNTAVTYCRNMRGRLPQFIIALILQSSSSRKRCSLLFSILLTVHFVLLAISSAKYSVYVSTLFIIRTNKSTQLTVRAQISIMKVSVFTM